MSILITDFQLECSLAPRLVAELLLVKPLHEYGIEHEVQSHWHPDH